MIIIVTNILLVLAGVMFGCASIYKPYDAFPIWGCMFLSLAFVVIQGWVREAARTIDD